MNKKGRQFKDRVPFSNKPYSTEPSAHNPVFKTKIDEKCPFCESRKIHHSGWKLWMHFLTFHRDEPRKKSIIISIAEKIILEMER